MSFRRISQSLVALIVITTLMISVCDSLPKYCQCIESNGNPFSAFAEYNIKDGKRTDFWLYQNKHRCRMYIKNETEIVIDTSGQIQTLYENYRQWFGFYYYNSNYGNYVFECRTYQKSQSEYPMECRIANEDFEYKLGINEYEYSNALVFLKETETQLTLPVVLLFQNKSDGNWRRSEKTVIIRLNIYDTSLFTFEFNILRDSVRVSNQMRVLLYDIPKNVYINAVLNDYNAKYRPHNGFFIFVTINGIPMYCYKSHIYDQNDSCKTENLKPFMRECFPTTETTMNTIITTEKPMTSIKTTFSLKTTNERTKSTSISPSISTINQLMTTFHSTESPSTTKFLIIIITIIVIIILIAIIISFILYILHKRKNDNNVSVGSTFTPSIQTNKL